MMKLVAIREEEFLKKFPDMDKNTLIGCICFYSEDKHFGCYRDMRTYDVGFKTNGETIPLTPNEEAQLLTILANNESDAIERADTYKQLEAGNLHIKEIEDIQDSITPIEKENKKKSHKYIWEIILGLGLIIMATAVILLIQKIGLR